MDSKQTQFSLDELAERAGIPARTIRYYIATRLIDGPASRGKLASYGEDHLLRLRLIRRLTARHLPLEEVAARLEGLTIADVQALLDAEEHNATALEQAAREPSPKAYIESLLRLATPDRRPMPAPAPPVTKSALQVSSTPSPPQPPAGFSKRRQVDEHQDTTHGSPARATGASWKRWQIAPGIELQVLASAEAAYSAIIDRLLQVAEDLQRGSQ